MKVTLIVLIALAVSAALSKRSAAVRHWVLAMALICAGLTPFLGLMLPQWHPPIVDRPGMQSAADATGAAVTTAEQFSLPTGTIPTNASGLPAVSLEQALRVIWLVGIALSVVVLLVGLGRLAWLASHARRVSDPRWEKLLGPVALLQSAHPTLLVTWGLFKPKIVLPASATQWSEERMRVVLWHELAHIRRGDWSVQMLVELLRAVYWFNPVVWLACRRLRQESEHACDDEVLGCGVDGADYATELLGLARDLRQPRLRFSGFPAPAMARPSSLGRRVSAMLNAQVDRSPMTKAARGAIALVLFLIAIPIAAAQAFATFSGTLVDTTGAPMPGATVVLTNPERQSRYEVTTTPTGTFEFVGLPAGGYELEATTPGFRAFRDKVSFTAGQNLRRVLELKIGSLSEAITVTDDGGRDAAADPIIRAERAEPAPCTPNGTGGNIRTPKKLFDMRPFYPSSLRGTGVQGVAILGATIGVDGLVKDIEVLRSPNPELADAAVTALRQWEYSPTLLNCSPVEVKITATMNFTARP